MSEELLFMMILTNVIIVLNIKRFEHKSESFVIKLLCHFLAEKTTNQIRLWQLATKIFAFLIMCFVRNVFLWFCENNILSAKLHVSCTICVNFHNMFYANIQVSCRIIIYPYVLCGLCWAMCEVLSSFKPV